MYDTKFAQNEFEKNGETLLQQKLSGKLNTIFDVGCNIGEWTRMARKYNPDAKIHMFEIMSQTYEKMLHNIDVDEKTIPNGFGLSDVCGSLPMKYMKNFDAQSTCVAKMYTEGYDWKTGLTMTGDLYTESREIKYIDFLKLDTEGCEKNILEGFRKNFEQSKIGMVQFEYGFINVLTKWLLVDFYQFFNPLGYTMGKITPQGVILRDYQLTDEDFIGPNYLAVHQSKKHLIY